MASATANRTAPSCNHELPKAKHWGVAWTRSRSEKVLVEFFQERNVPAFLPLVARRRIYGGRVRHSQIPLFPGYVFFDLDSIERREVFSSRKVVGVLSPDDPEQLRRQLGHLCKALQGAEGLTAARRLKAGQPVRVIGGSLRGVEGELIRTKGACLLLIRVSFIGKVAELEIDEGLVETVI